tara:strand:+ start:467 stop:1099 length:633 start_codon:yes stop_codon:yes gene_type:complete
MKKKLFIIGIAGGSGSGKTRAAKNLLERFDENDIALIEQDSYYNDLKHISFDEREKNNFDHPNSIDFNLMHTDLSSLINNSSVSIPIYDYKRHVRKDRKLEISNKKVIILEGIFALYDSRIRELIDLKIFVDTPADIRVIRRIKRDINKRGRDLTSIIKQYFSTVRNMHFKFVEPTKKFADIILNEGGKNPVAIKTIENTINTMLMEIDG